MRFKYAAEICRAYKNSRKCPLSGICKILISALIKY